MKPAGSEATEAPLSGALSPAQLRTLQQRSNARGLARLAGHLLLMGLCACAYAWTLSRAADVWAGGMVNTAAVLVCWALLVVLTCVGYGFTLVTMFAAMHETVHRTAFKRQWLNDAVAWFAGLLSFYNSSFYRPYHGWHHRFTQIAGKDPELEDKKPTDWPSYLLELSAATWWLGKLRTYAKLALGRSEAYGFLTPENAPSVVRSVRWQLSVYAGLALLSWWLGYPYFVVYWLLPVAVAQPLLRAILLAEHTGCSNDDNAYANTRTTYTWWPVRFLMWDMPYHAEHHRYPALPFFALAQAHQSLRPRLEHVAARGYFALQLELIRSWRKRTQEMAHE